MARPGCRRLGHHAPDSHTPRRLSSWDVRAGRLRPETPETAHATAHEAPRESVQSQMCPISATRESGQGAQYRWRRGERHDSRARRAEAAGAVARGHPGEVNVRVAAAGAAARRTVARVAVVADELNRGREGADGAECRSAHMRASSRRRARGVLRWHRARVGRARRAAGAHGGAVRRRGRAARRDRAYPGAARTARRRGGASVRRTAY
jgi:hypothetical protein